MAKSRFMLMLVALFLLLCLFAAMQFSPTFQNCSYAVEVTATSNVDKYTQIWEITFRNPFDVMWIVFERGSNIDPLFPLELEFIGHESQAIHVSKSGNADDITVIFGISPYGNKLPTNTVNFLVGKKASPKIREVLGASHGELEVYHHCYPYTGD